MERYLGLFTVESGARELMSSGSALISSSFICAVRSNSLGSLAIFFGLSLLISAGIGLVQVENYNLYTSMCQMCLPAVLEHSLFARLIN